jgi:hypothetical protein
VFVGPAPVALISGANKYEPAMNRIPSNYSVNPEMPAIAQSHLYRQPHDCLSVCPLVRAVNEIESGPPQFDN